MGKEEKNLKSKCKIKYLLMSIFISLVIIILPNRIYAAWYEGGLTHINDRSVASVFYSMRYFAEKDGEDRRKWIQQEYTGNAIDNK